MREVAVWEEVDDTLLWHLGEIAYNNVRDRLFSNLENESRCERLRRKRHTDDEALFVFTLYVFDDNRRHEFEFQVDEAIADTHRFVVGVVHQDEIVW